MEMSGEPHDPVALPPGKQSPVLIEQEAGGGPLRAGLDVLVKKEIPFPNRESNHVSSRP